MSDLRRILLEEYSLPVGGVDELVSVVELYRDTAARLAELKKQEQGARGLPRCSGTTHLRDGKYLKLNHSPTQARRHGPCPLHGEKSNGKRLVVYVGADESDQEAANQWQMNWLQWRNLLQKIENEEYKLRRFDGYINSFHWKVNTRAEKR